MFTHCHVGGAAGAASFGLGVDEASADAKVAQFDLTFRVQQDVGGFDVSVDDAVLFFQIQQRLDDLERRKPSVTFFPPPLPVTKQHLMRFSSLTHCDCHLSENPLRDGTLDSFLQLLSARSHQLHGDEYIRLRETRAQHI